MVPELVLVDREAIIRELRQVFDARTSETMLRVLDRVAEQVRASGVTREDFRELKQVVVDLVESHRHSEARLGSVEARLERLEAILQELVEQVKVLTQTVSALATHVKEMDDRLGNLVGRVMELSYREKAASYFGYFLRKPRVVSIVDLLDTLEQRLSTQELNDLLPLDLIVRGQPRERQELGEVLLAVEVSATVDEGDVARARRRATWLRQAGYRAIPVVAGEKVTQNGETEARDQSAVILRDGQATLWDEALAVWVVG